MDEDYADLVGQIDNQIPPLKLGPTTMSCPVCLGIRYEQKMFRCIHCGKLICEECRDDLRSQWCKRCANGPREIKLQFNQVETPAGRWLVRIESDLIGEPFYSREMLFEYPHNLEIGKPQTTLTTQLPDQDSDEESNIFFGKYSGDNNLAILNSPLTVFSAENISSQDKSSEIVDDLYRGDANQISRQTHDDSLVGASLEHNISNLEGITDTVPDALSLIDWGSILFESIFPANSWSDLEGAFRREILSGGDVRLVLLDLDPEIAILPWERFSLPGQNVISVVRIFSNIPTAVLGPSTAPLKILSIESHTVDAFNSEVSDISRNSYLEYTELKAGLTEELDGGVLHIDVFKPSTDGPAEDTRDTLRKAMQDPHILYFSGSWEVVDEPTLMLIGRFANETLISLPLEQLSLWLQDSQAQLVVWDCHLFTKGVEKCWIEFSSFSPSLFLQGKVIGFVAPREFMEPNSILRFITNLFSNLARQKGLEKSINASRRYLISNALRSSDVTWSVPALFCRDWAGSFLNLMASSDQALETRLLEIVEPFVEEDLSDVKVEEGPKQLSKIVVGLSQRRLQMILGETDAMPFEVGRQAMFSYTSNNEKVLRYPRYEPIEDFIYNARRLPNGTHLLLDTAELSLIGSEMDALLDLVKQKDLYLVVTSTVDLEKDEKGVELSSWLKSNKKFHVVLKDGDFSKETVRKSLLRQVEDAHDNAIISTSVANDLSRIANTEAEFSDLYLDLRLPGQINRLIHGHLASQIYLSLDVDGVKRIIRESISSPDTIRRWFNGELSQSEQVLLMMLALLPGLPVSQIFPIYQSAVKSLRESYFIELIVLPIHASLRRWNSYLYERNQVVPRVGKVGYVDFRLAQHANQLLSILRDDYWEWMSEVLNTLQRYLLETISPATSDKSLGTKNTDRRVLRQAISRALGFIAMRSVDSLRLVISVLDEIISKASSRGRLRAEWEILAIPGQVISYITEAGDPILESSIRSILNEWRQRRELNFRLAAISSYGQVARRMQPEKLLLPLLSVVRDAQDRSERVISQMRRSNTTPNKESLESLQASVEERRAVSYSLRFFPSTSLPTLMEIYDKLAADHDHETRSRVAIALARSSNNPDMVKTWIEHWASTNNWRVWWTAVASTVLLYEVGKIENDLAKELTKKLIETANYIAVRQNKAAEDLGQDMAWAVMTCLRHADDLADVRPTLRPTINLFLSLLGEKPSTDLVVRGTLMRLSESGDHLLGEARNILIDVFLDQLDLNSYSLDTTARRTAIEILISVGEIRKPACQKKLRVLAEFEAFDYRWLAGRSLNTLPLDRLGEGGLILQLLLGGDENAVNNTLPYLYQLGSIGSTSELRTISPFVLSNLGVARKDLLGIVINNLRAWLNTSNGPLQITAIDGLIGLYRGLPYDQGDQLFEYILNSIDKIQPKTINYVNSLIPELTRINPLASSVLSERLSSRTAGTVLGV